MTINKQLAGVVVVLGLALWYFRRRVTAERAPIPSVTTETSFNLGVTNEIKRFAEAIARAEGYYVGGSIPFRANNPGNLTSPSWTFAGELEGQTLGAEKIAVFSTSQQGWNALYNQLVLIINGQSSVYTLDDTIASMGAKYANGAPEWAYNVAAYLKVPQSTKLYEVLI